MKRTKEETYAAHRAWYAANKEDQRAKKRAYYARPEVKVRVKEWHAVHYQDHREERIAYAANQRIEKAAEMKAQRQAAYAADPEKYKARIKEWQEANPEKVRAAKKARWEKYRDENLEKLRVWNAAHPELAAERDKRRRARVRNLKAAIIRKPQLDAKWRYWGGKCWMCGTDACEWDHVKPISKGGAHILANMRPACRSCNAKKSASWPIEVAA